MLKSYNLVQNGCNIESNCPDCDSYFRIEDCILDDVDGATCDCNKCGKLLILSNGKVYDFHKKIHDNNSLWPEDGVGTGYIDV